MCHVIKCEEPSLFDRSMIHIHMPMPMPMHMHMHMHIAYVCEWGSQRGAENSDLCNLVSCAQARQVKSSKGRPVGSNAGGE